MPAASRPGTSTSAIIAPPSPEASIRRNAPSRGDPSSELTAAKLPAAPSTALICSGGSRLTIRTAPAASPPPSARRGASGPRTAPKQSVARAAAKMPGSSMGVGAPVGLNPAVGSWPPCPGRY